MPKQGEIDYLKNIGRDGQEHALNKPFSDANCGLYLSDLGAILSLLPPPPAKLFDLGAGSGWTSIFFSKRGYHVTGQDIAEDMITQANINKERSNAKDIQFIVSDYEDLRLNAQFDCAVFYDSLHHAVDEKKAILAAYKSLKPGGMCITVEPGIGHAESPESRNAMRKFGVTERDMPPRLIIEAGKAAGFTQFKIYARPSKPIEIHKRSKIEELRNLLRLMNRLLGHKSDMSDLASNIVVMIK